MPDKSGGSPTGKGEDRSEFQLLVVDKAEAAIFPSSRVRGSGVWYRATRSAAAGCSAAEDHPGGSRALPRFFFAHSQTTHQIQVSAHGNAAQQSNATAALYHIDSSEMLKLTTEVSKFNTNYYVWLKQVQNYLAQQRAA
ncbi:MAG TPA: hypothetical protein VH598_04045, partial [Verrucomicrobiae bacterium]|nr:hypothetical protein [Verrucomicrobiae bacterium]